MNASVLLMKTHAKLFASFQVLLALTLQAECASIWYTGENKPYDFGYAIEGNQHRRESKGK